MSFVITPVAASATLAVQGAFVAHCASELPDIPVWDYVPETQDYPYITVGEAVETPDNTHGRFGRRVALVVHVWARGREGFAPALQIVSRLQGAFDQAEHRIPIVGHRLQSVRLVDARPMRDPDPLVRHVPVTLAFHTEQLPDG